MKNRLIKNKWLPITVTALIFITLLIGLLVGDGRVLVVFIPIIVSTAVLLFITVLLMKLFGSSKTDVDSQALNAKPANTLINKCLAILITVSLIIGTYSAIHSLSLDPQDGKFIYNNLANILGCTTIALVLIMRAIQNDIFWITKDKKMKLDERQMKERHEVLEFSYKIGAWLVLFTALLLSFNKEHLPALLNNATNFNVTPGAFFWPFYNVAITLFALPLVIAAIRQKS